MRKISEIFINGVCLKEILEKHNKWLKEEDGGEMAEVKNFDDDRWNECSTGIHFFITRDEAIIYQN